MPRCRWVPPQAPGPRWLLSPSPSQPCSRWPEPASALLCCPEQALCLQVCRGATSPTPGEQGRGFLLQLQHSTRRQAQGRGLEAWLSCRPVTQPAWPLSPLQSRSKVIPRGWWSKEGSGHSGGHSRCCQGIPCLEASLVPALLVLLPGQATDKAPACWTLMLAREEPEGLLRGATGPVEQDEDHVDSRRPGALWGGGPAGRPGAGQQGRSSFTGRSEGWCLGGLDWMTLWRGGVDVSLQDPSEPLASAPGRAGLVRNLGPWPRPAELACSPAVPGQWWSAVRCWAPSPLHLSLLWEATCLPPSRV